MVCNFYLKILKEGLQFTFSERKKKKKEESEIYDIDKIMSQ